jgi:hypothetical protein
LQHSTCTCWPKTIEEDKTMDQSSHWTSMKKRYLRMKEDFKLDWANGIEWCSCSMQWNNESQTSITNLSDHKMPNNNQAWHLHLHTTETPYSVDQ